MSRVPRLWFQRGLKYRTYETYLIQTPFKGHDIRIPSRDSLAPWAHLRPDGMLIVREGFAWDGPSGPTIDTKSSMVPSLVHDVLYWMSRLGLFKWTRELADQFFYELCIQCGMWKARAWLWKKGLKVGAAYAFKQRPDEVLEAP